MSHPSLHQVSWYLPKGLYDALQALQEILKTTTLQPAWGSVEALAIHFLSVAVREAHKEISTKAQSSRLVRLPGEVWP